LKVYTPLAKQRLALVHVTLVGTLAAVLLCTAGMSRAVVGRAGGTSCLFPPAGAAFLPATCTHGPIQYLRQYPVVKLATPVQQARAQRLHDELVAAAKEGNWTDLGAVARAGYHTHRTPRTDAKVHYFHAEHPPEPRPGGVLNVHRPKAIIFANAPGRPLVLVGAMWTTKPDERGPTPGGPLTRWHSHLSCADGHMAGMANMPGMTSPSSTTVLCPPGSHLHLGRVEMMHIWFTHDLRSAFALTAPEPELCKLAVLPRSYCRSLPAARS
jgi:hypothetical protein